jgi:hypothetical protein
MNIPSFVKLLALPILLGTFIFCNKGGTVEPGETEYRLACKSPHYYMLSDFKSGHASILSPDRKSQVLLTKSFSYEVFHEGRGIGTVPPFADVYSNVQVMWAPDSRMVFLVGEVFPTSDCGDISGREGGYLVDLDGRIIHRYDDK